MRSTAALLVTALFTLGCFGGAARTDADTADGTRENTSATIDPDVQCGADAVEFFASTEGPVASIAVDAYAGEDLVGTVDLVARGDGDWYASTDDPDIVSACMDGSSSYFLFRATTEDGEEIDEGI